MNQKMRNALSAPLHLSVRIQRLYQRINLPGALLLLLLQRTPVLNLLVSSDEMVIASPAGNVLKSVVAAVAALGAVNTMAGATPLVPSSGSATGVTLAAGTSANIFYTVDGTETPPASWQITGPIPAGLNFSGLTSAGDVDVSALQLSGIPTTAGTYNLTIQTFEFTGEGGVASPVYNYTITVTGSVSSTAPAITTQPTSQVVTAGSSVTFTGSASGNPTPTYQWQKNGTSISGATNSTFTISSAATTDSGTYTLVATNSAGTATSTGATLTVNAATSAPTFTTQPSNQTVVVGGSATFTAAANGSPTPTFQWQKNGAAISGATNATFTIATVASSDAGTYTVVATNSVSSVTSSAATLTVNAAPVAPAITTQPASVSVAVGATASFTVVATGTPTPTLQWQKGGVNITGATTATFTIASVAATDAATYTVVVTNSAGTVTSTGATLTIAVVNAAPVITTQPASQSVATGSPVTFSVVATGTPAPTYQWQKGGVNISGATTNSITIASPASADAGTYTVVITNSLGSVTSSGATLTLTAAAATKVASATVTTGHTATFSAGNTAGAIQWQISTNGGSSWTNVANDGTTYSGATTANLTITNAGSSISSDQYRFVATNAGVVSTSNGATLTVAQAFFPFPTCIAVDSSGNLYLADGNSDTVQKVNTSLQVSLIAGTSGTAGSTDGLGAAARFNQPGGITLLASGVLIVTDTANATIRSIGTDGTVTTLAGSAPNRGSADGVGTAATFSMPMGIARDSGGNLYVADAMNDTIRKIVSSTVTTLAGTAGATGTTNANGVSARFNFPTGVAVDSNGNIFVADTTNNTIREIGPTGDVTTYAGLEGVSGFVDGTGRSALFNHPGGLAIDGSGYVYVADTGNSTVRKIAAGGVVTTIAGTPTIAGLEDGTGIGALLNQPKAVAVDSSGNVFVADTANATIRKITPAGVVTTLVLSAAPAVVVTPPVTTPTPPATTSPVPSSGGGGGGGAPSTWFLSILAALASVRWMQTARRRQCEAS